MAEVTPRLLFYGFIMFTVVVFGGIYIMGQFAISNPNYINNEKFVGFNSSFNKVAELSEASTNLEESITKADTDWGIFGVINSLIKSVWSAFTNIFSTIGFMFDALTGFTTVFGVPAQIVGLFVSLIVVMIAFSIFSLVFAGRT